jgi:hypothetical protein
MPKLGAAISLEPDDNHVFAPTRRVVSAVHATSDFGMSLAGIGAPM